MKSPWLFLHATDSGYFMIFYVKYKMLWFFMILWRVGPLSQWEHNHSKQNVQQATSKDSNKEAKNKMATTKG